ncbi:TPA: hypothetical protein ACVOYU_003234 [Vibrio alginolyticus]
MVSKKDLVDVMKSRRRLWSPSELCDELGIHVCDLVRLVKAARRSGVDVRHESSELTGFSSKYWLAEGVEC